MIKLLTCFLLAGVAFADDVRPTAPIAFTDLDTAKLQVAALQSSNMALQAKIAGLEKTIQELQSQLSQVLGNPVFVGICEAAKIPVADCTTSPDGKAVQRRPKP